MPLTGLNSNSIWLAVLEVPSRIPGIDMRFLSLYAIHVYRILNFFSTLLLLPVHMCVRILM